MSRYFFALAFASAGMALAQSGFFVTGRVTDTSGAVVKRASVNLYSRSGGNRYLALTDAAGRYSVVVSRGTYIVDASATGLALPGPPPVLEVDRSIELPIHLAPGPVRSAVEVTATGTAQSLFETAKAADVLSRAEFDARGVTSVAEAINEVPGLRVAQRGGPGYSTTIQIRGLRSFDTAVLIDGMRFRDVSATQGDASSFTTDLLLVDTARVEVLRGAGSSIYGTNAIGGAINVVTDSGNGPFHGSVTADGGGLGEFRGVARFGGSTQKNRLHYSAGAGHQNVTDNVGGFGTYRNTTGNGLVEYTFRPGMVLSGRLLATDVFGQLYNTPNAAPVAALPRSGRIAAVAPPASQIVLAEQKLPFQLSGATFIPALGDPDSYRTARFVSSLVGWQQQLSASANYRATYQSFQSNRDFVNGPLGTGFQSPFRTVNQFNGRIDTARFQGNLAAGSHHLLSAGYEWELEHFDSPSHDDNPDPALQVNSRTQVSEGSHTVDAQDQVRLFRDRLQISLSGRVQHFALSNPKFLGTVPVYSAIVESSPPNAYTADIAIAYYAQATGTKVRSHAGNGYRKPSLYELFGTTFFENSFSAYGDPRLKPERSVSIDGGFDQYFASEKLRVSGSYFYTRLQQVIAFDSSGFLQASNDPFGRASGYRNTGGALARGVEISSEVRPWRSARFTTSYTYTNARDRFAQFADGTQQTPRISPHVFSGVWMQQFGKRVDVSFSFTAASAFLYQLSRRTFVFPGSRLAALTLGYTQRLTERANVRWYMRINNLGDQVYYEDGYRTPRRWAVAGAMLSF